ncbi:MAG: glutathione S-transferase [Hyphomicrobiales bacterium]|nr:MAG: glutathione S-transferase [Hyphomicrobiales bacterium]
MKLIIGNQNYSTWSLRPWLLLSAFELKFNDQLVSLLGAGASARLATFSDAKKVPVLIDEGVAIWDTLAICEYISENYIDGKGWPAEKMQRALARSLTAEMHSSFASIRNEMPMNISARRRVDLSDLAKAEITYIGGIWTKHLDDAFLFGDYGIVDCFFTPVASRFKTYGVELSPLAQAYADRLLAHPAMQKWTAAALLETEILPLAEVGVEV